MNKLSRMLLVVASTVVILGAMYSPTFASPEVPSTSSAPDTPIPSASTITSPTPTPTPTATPTSTPTTNPSQSPSTTPSLGASLEGYAYIANSKLIVPNVKVTLYQQGKSQTTTTDINGYYQFASVKPAVMASIEAEASFVKLSQTIITPSLQKGINKYNIHFTILGGNCIYGTTRYKSSVSVKDNSASGVTIKVFEVKTSKSVLIGKTVSNYGEYEFCSSLLVSGKNYRIEPWQDDTKKIGSPASVSFNNNFGGRIQANLTIDSSIGYKYKVEIIVTDQLTQKPIQGANVTLTSYLKKYSAKTTSKGLATLSNIPLGGYELRVDKKNYNTKSRFIDLYTKPDTNGNLIYIEMSPDTNSGPIDCVKHSQNNVAEFWFCGSDAKKLYTEKSSLFEKIDSLIGKLRQDYPEAGTFPLQIIISSDATYSIEMFESNEDECPNKLLYANERGPSTLEELINISPIFLTKSSEYTISHGLIHEFGHGLDAHKNNCQEVWWSGVEKNNFSSVVKYGSNFSDYYPILKDSLYHPEEYTDFGHPADSVREAFASAFHAGYSHINEFTANAIKAGGPVDSILFETVRLATEK